MALETKALLESEPAERITLNNQRLEHVRRAVEDNDFVVAFNDLMAMMSETPKESLTLYSGALIDIWQLAQSKASSDEKAIEQKKFECALVVMLENMLALTTALEYPLSSEGDLPLSSGDVVERLNNFSINGVRQAAARKHWATAARFADHVERINRELSICDDMLLSTVRYNNNQPEKAKAYLWDAATINKFSKVMVTDTVMTLLLYLLMFDDWRDTCFVLGPKLNRQLSDKIASHGVKGLYCGKFLKNVDSDREIITGLASYVLSKNISVYGHDHVRSISGGFVSETFSVIEDGTGNYRPTPPKPRKILKDGGSIVPFGYDKMIKRVYLTGRLPIPDIIKDKVIIFSMSECWKNKSPEEQAVLLDVFSVPVKKLKALIAEGRTQILLTQPMYVFYRGKEQIRMKSVMIDFYKKILERYDKSRVMIKLHPAEKINYERYFPEYPVVRDQFPMELMAFMDTGNQIDRIISIHSSAGYGVFDESKVDTYAKEWLHFVKTGELD